MREIAVIFLLVKSLVAIETSDRLFECTEIFKERKSELLIELERIDEQKQALSALKVATEELLKQKEQKLSLKEERVEKKLQEITKKEASLKELTQKNELLLEKLTDTKMGKVAQTFAKMKAASAASILTNMSGEEAVEILRSLKPKSVGQILSKMDAQKASEITLLLVK